MVLNFGTNMNGRTQKESQMNRSGKYLIIVVVSLLILVATIPNCTRNPSKNMITIGSGDAPRAMPQQGAIAARQPSFTSSKDAKMTSAVIEIPFLGQVTVKQVKQPVNYTSGRPEQEWVFSWSEDGSFVQADYQRNGFQTRPRNYTSEDVHEVRDEKILSIVKGAAKFEFERIIKLIDEYCEEHVVDKVRVRRVVMTSPIHGEAGRPLYLVNIWSEDVYPVKSVGLANDYVRVVLDESGKEIGGDNGE